VSPETIGRWIQEDEECGAAREMNAPIDPDFRAAELRQLAHTLFDQWVALAL
jgi:hypothetical protein